MKLLEPVYNFSELLGALLLVILAVRIAKIRVLSPNVLNFHGKLNDCVLKCANSDLTTTSN